MSLLNDDIPRSSLVKAGSQAEQYENLASKEMPHRRLTPWSKHEDNKLIALVASAVNNNPLIDWFAISQKIGTRSPMDCSERYKYLDPQFQPQHNIPLPASGSSEDKSGGSSIVELRTSPSTSSAEGDIEIWEQVSLKQSITLTSII